MSEAEYVKSVGRTEVTLDSGENILLNVLLALTVISLFLALRRGDRKTLFSPNKIKTSTLFIIAGIAYGLGNLWTEVKKCFFAKNAKTVPKLLSL
jgi:hypothetical protein